MSKQHGHSAWSRFMGRLRTLFLSGVVVVVPVVASVLVLVWAFRTADDFLQPIIHNILGINIIGLGIVFTVVIIFLVGMLAHNFVGKKLIQLGDAILKRIPIFKQIYNGAKQIMASFSGTGAISRTAFREVVLVEFPANSMRTIAFITNEYTAGDGHKYYAIYLPTSPVPWSGFSAIVAEENMTRSDISVDEALKMCISGMMLAPSQMLINIDGKPVNLTITKKPATIEAETPPSV
ncbi:MAG: DUF502 domain-containing protein [Dehalococcoidia bacterium]|nr:DUF502 domain-containing protein [Dehalococcoidia bacterium]